MIHVFTSAATNYLAKVRLLCRSIKEFYPEVTVHVALADEVSSWLDISAELFDPKSSYHIRFCFEINWTLG